MQYTIGASKIACTITGKEKIPYHPILIIISCSPVWATIVVRVFCPIRKLLGQQMHLFHGMADILRSHSFGGSIYATKVTGFSDFQRF